MAVEPYLPRLTARLADGVSRLPDEVRARHVAYLQSAQNPDGGFSGREGGSDLYYTGFALRGFAVLDALTPAICERAAGFLRGTLTQQTSIVDFFSLLYSSLLVQSFGGPDVLGDSPPEWPDRVAETLESFRTSDGGYTKSLGGIAGSTYHTFLVALCYQLLGRSVPRMSDVVGFVASAPDFTGQPGVVNGASELLGDVFGDAGRHARSAVGVAALPLDAPVEVELVVEVG